MEKHRFKKRLYWVSLFFITLSGFAQMPIFKRYYIADIPGLDWLAEFYITHVIHYVSAIVLIGLVCYLFTYFLIQRHRLADLTRTAYLKIGLLAGLIATGGLMVYKNLPGVYFSHGLISILDLVHLGLCMFLLFAGLYSVIRRKKWVKSR